MTHVVLHVLLLLALLCSSSSARWVYGKESHSGLRSERTGDVVPYILTTTPLNTAVVTGYRTSFICISNTSADLNWLFLPIGSAPGTGIQLVIGCQLNPAYSDRFDIQRVGFGQCDLIVRNATVQDAGTYTCAQAAYFDPVASAQLVVIDSDPVCTVDNTAPVPGENVTMSCDVRYTTNLSPMSMNWADSAGNPISEDNENTVPGRTTSFIVLEAFAPVVNRHVCTTVFDLPTGTPPLAATNTPDYSHAFTSDVINVHYCPTEINTNASTVHSVGDAIICWANGYPEPDYVWYEAGGPTTSGSVLILRTAGQFTFNCTATVVIRGTPCSVSTAIQVLVTDSGPVNRPRNVALLVGTNTTLNCKYGSLPINWIFAATSNNIGVQVVSECVVLSPYVDVLAVDQDDEACNLIIPNATLFHSGRFTCQDNRNQERPSSALVIVLESGPVCETNASSDGAVSGSLIQYTCAMNFSGTLRPHFLWSTIAGQPINNATEVNTTTHVQSSIVLTAYPTTMQPVVSQTYFDAPPPPQPPFLTDPAPNAPAYNERWTSPAVNVLYCPTTITISPSVSVVFVGENFTCSSDGFPTPSYEWQNLATGEVTQGPDLMVTSPGNTRYICTARSTVSPSNCDRSSAIDVVAIDAVTPLNQAEVSGKPVTFQCRFRTQRVIWLFAPVGTTSSVSIANDCEPLPAYRDKYRIDNSSYSCNLHIENPTPDEAGTYTCQDYTSGTDLPSSAQLVVLETEPQCSSNASSAQEPGMHVQLSCNVTYHGNIAPKMTWSEHNLTELTNGTDSITDWMKLEQNSLSKSLKSGVGSFIESSVDIVIQVGTLIYSCLTYFDPPTFTPPPHIDAAWNEPPYTYMYNWTSNVTDVEGCSSNPCDINMECVETGSGYECTCSPTSVGATRVRGFSMNARDCYEILQADSTAPSGVYNILVGPSNTTVQVYCDMKTTGGGWTVFQRRKDGSVDFYRNWAAYAAGFGDAAEEFYLGNDNIAALTGSKTYVLRVDLGNYACDLRHAEFNNFTVSPAADDYRLATLGTYSGTAGDSLRYHLGAIFSTYDRHVTSCTLSRQGAWWYNPCDNSNLNGRYGINNQSGIIWDSWPGTQTSAKFSEMKIRPV